LSVTGNYTETSTVDVLSDSSDVTIDIVSPELTIARFSKGQGIHAYRYCYLDRRSLTGKPGSITNLTDYKNGLYGVNTKSLCDDRVKIVRRWLNDIVTGECNYTTAYHIQMGFDWCDKHNRGAGLLAEQSSKDLYVDYTNELLHRVRLSKVGKKEGIGRAHAAALQRAFRKLIGYTTGRSDSVVMTWAPVIEKRKGIESLPQANLSDAEAKKAFEMHRRFFWAYSDAVIKNSASPLVVKLDDLGFENLITFGGQANNYQSWGNNRVNSRGWQQFAFSEQGFDSDWRSIKEKAAIKGIDLDRKAYKAFWGSAKTFSKRKFTPRTLTNFSNRAMKHFGYLLMFASGCNADHLDGIDVENSMQEKASGSKRLIAHKDRSSNEKQQLSVSTHFSKQWRQFLLLREWMSKFHDKPYPSYGLCIFITNTSSSRFPVDSFEALSHESIKCGLFWPEGAPGLLTRAPRKIVSQKKLELSGGNVGLVASLLSQSEATVRKHYAFRDQDEASKQLSRFFEGMRVSANLRVSGVASAPVIAGGKRIPVGQCVAESESDIRLIQGIDEQRAPELNCGSPLSCFFCESFGIHSDLTDIKRLLSVKEYIRYQSNHKSHSINEHGQKFLPVVARIDEIIEAFSQRDSASKKIVESASEGIKRGELDKFWLAHINALIDAMEA
jgi:hypothetical protein